MTVHHRRQSDETRSNDTQKKKTWDFCAIRNIKRGILIMRVNNYGEFEDRRVKLLFQANDITPILCLVQ